MTPVNLARQLCIVVACNNDACLERNLLASDLVVKHGVSVHVERGAPSASIAYNRGLDATDAPYVIFAHQDVYLPPSWLENLASAIETISVQDPDWALLAPIGMALDEEHIGDIWTTCLNKRVGRPVKDPEAAQSVDEQIFVLGRATGLRFDEKLPFYHLYGTDIVQAAWASGHGAYVANIPVVHNDGFKGRLRGDFTAGFEYVRRKWKAALPLRTTVLRISWHGLNLPYYRFRTWRSFARRQSMAGDETADPRGFSALCGWE